MCVFDLLYYLLGFVFSQVRIEKLNPRWTSSITIGVAGFLPRKISLPQSAMFIKQPCWLVNAGAVFQSGVKVCIHPSSANHMSDCLFAFLLAF